MDIWRLCYKKSQHNKLKIKEFNNSARSQLNVDTHK